MPCRDMARIALAAVLCGSLGASSSLGAVGPGRIVWTDVFDLDRHNDAASAVAVSGGRAFVAGNGAVRGRTVNVDAVLRAYSVESGELLWSDVFDLGKQHTAWGDVAAAGRVVVAVGGIIVRGGGVSSDVLVHAYRARSGQRMWSHRLTGSLFPRVVISGETAFVMTRVDDPRTPNPIEISAYRVGNGRLRWARPIVSSRFSSGRAMVTEADRLYVVGQSFDSRGVDGRFFIGAFDAATGNDLWQDTTAGRGGATAAALADGTVYAVGSLEPPDGRGGSGLFVRAYATTDGRVLWEDWFRRNRAAKAGAVVAAGGRVFVAGDVGKLGSTPVQRVLRAYDADTGSLVWQDRHGRQGRADGSFSEVAHSAGVVYAVGSGARSQSLNFVVHAFDAATGLLVWRDIHDRSGKLDIANAVAVTETRVVVAGVETGGGRANDFVVRTYRSR